MKENNKRQSEEDLIHEVIRGNKKSFAELYALHFDALYRFVYSRTGSTHETEDIVSATWILIIENIGKFNFKSKFTTFLFGFALNLLRRHYTNEKMSGLVEDTIADDLEPEEETDSAAGYIEKIKLVMPQLRQNYKDVIQNRYFEEKSLKETAAQLNLTVQNVKVLQNRAIRKIKELLS